MLFYFEAYCQWNHFFSLEASDGLEKEVLPSEECAAENIWKYGVTNETKSAMDIHIIRIPDLHFADAVFGNRRYQSGARRFVGGRTDPQPDPERVFVEHLGWFMNVLHLVVDGSERVVEKYLWKYKRVVEMYLWKCFFFSCENGCNINTIKVEIYLRGEFF